MYFIILGVLLLLMKSTDFGVVAEWSWWAVLWPFGAAVIWWWWADKTGYTKRREMDKMEERKVNRRLKNLDALGLDYKGRRQKRKR